MARLVAAVVVSLLSWLALPARAVISVTAGPNGDGLIINTLLGADTFYNAGYYGQGAVVANVEAGHIWDGHETLSQGQVSAFVQDPSLDTLFPQRQYDYHATAVGQTIGGRGDLFYHQVGIAPLATLVSGAMATNWNDDHTFDTTNRSFAYPYIQTMQIGLNVTQTIQPGVTLTTFRKADVVNSSWGFDDETGGAFADFRSIAIDALARANGTTFVAAAGNAGPDPDTVLSPASAYNKIAVAALAADPGSAAYTQAASFSSRGPNSFYNPRTQEIIPNVRNVVDLAAPGDQLAVAYYGGTTGTNANGSLPTYTENNLYWTNAAGTSFAAPIVAGGAALLVSLGRADPITYGPHATDGRVIKAVLLNSADKVPGWDNAQSRGADGVVRTTSSLDPALGAGRANFARAYAQYLGGTTDFPGDAAPGLSNPVFLTGWDYANTKPDEPGDYLLGSPLHAGQTLTATVTWFIDRSINADALTASDDRFVNLDLQVWEMKDGSLAREVAESSSVYNNVEHLSFPVPEDGDYALRVLWSGINYAMNGDTTSPQDYALAWSDAVVAVPEPAAGMLMVAVVGGLVVLTVRRERRPRSLGDGHRR
jgi:hypothetical protein